jgi:hypothetical protein
MEKNNSTEVIATLPYEPPARRLVVAGRITAGKLRQLVDLVWAAQQVEP